MDAKFVLTCWDIPSGEVADHRWGELAGGMHQLAFLGAELTDCIDDAAVERTILRLHYHVVSFLHQTYWLRERAVWLAAHLCNDITLADRLKLGTSRPDAFAQVARQRPEIINSLADLLKNLKRDSALRNVHAHEKFVHLQIMVDGHIFDPIDVYSVDMAADVEKQKDFGGILIEAARKMSSEYVARIAAISAAVNTYLDATDSVLHR